MTVRPLARIAVPSRPFPDNPEPLRDDEFLYNFIWHQLSRWDGRAMFHMPQGWINTMAGGAWYGMPEYVRLVFADVIGRAKAEIPGSEIRVYSGFQFYSPYTIYGRPRGEGSGLQPFVAEPAWADADDPKTVRGIRDLSVQPWADIGVDGWIFDSGSKDPREIVRWKRQLRRQVSIVGLEAIPWVGDNEHGHVDWIWCERYGLEYHGLYRYRGGAPYREKVPDSCRDRAFFWIDRFHPPVPDVNELVDLMNRGWTPCPLGDDMDDLVTEALEQM